MNQLTLLLGGMFCVALGSILGYFARQSIAKRDWKTIEAKIQKRIEKASQKADKILGKAKAKARRVLKEAEEEEEAKRKRIFKAEQLLSKRESILDKKISQFEEKQEDLESKVEKLKGIKTRLESLKEEAIQKLEEISGLTEKEASEKLLQEVEKKYKKDILEKMEELEEEGYERYERKAKEILAIAIQKYALSQAQEITTSTVALPDEKIKGRIIGKEGRNIRALERATGVEFIIDETPETVVVSSFDPIRRQVAKIALEKLVLDGRIQPASIEKKVKEARKDVKEQINKAGKTAAYEVGLVGMKPKLMELLGRLKFRTSYGQNVLLHSIEVSYLASFLAEELEANVTVCKKAGLFHDIGKSVDHQIEGSHVDIGVKILEKFGVEKEVIEAMRAHHGDYPAETLESIIVQVADQISGARPGARKENLEDYLKRLADLENVATAFPEVDKAWALQAGREVRVFVKPDEIDDYRTQTLAREIAGKIENDLTYPGKIKVTVIREKRVIEYAK